LDGLQATLHGIVGARHVLTRPGSTRPYRTGFRHGAGGAEAVVRPGSLLELWCVVKACIAADRIIIMQAANTGLTGGSTPAGDDYERGVIIVNTLRCTGLHLIDAGRQVVCLPGTTLFELERTLKPLGRAPHSVIGSSCIGASVFGGICNNSGGSLVRRGPAFTEMALFARLYESGDLRLVNHLGIRLGEEPEGILHRLQVQDYTEADIEHDPSRQGSARDYAEHVRQIDAGTPARFNADPRCLFEASGSAGKVILFAVRLDTFPRDEETAVFYIGTNETSELTRIRREILGQFKTLPVAAEYIHREAFEIAEVYGKDTFLAIQGLGTDRLPGLFRQKARVDALAARIGIPNLGDRVLQWASRFFPDHLPRRIREFGPRYDHHLLLKMSREGVAEARIFLEEVFPSASGAYFECTEEEGAKAFLHRFAVAGAAIRYRAVHRDKVEDILALDIALPRNTTDWLEKLPPDMEAAIPHKLYYGHFLCHVFHQDYVIRKGANIDRLKARMCVLLDQRGAEYPAEHNVGHLYEAKPALVTFYRELDPRNQLNPGIGKTSKRFFWH
jgi:D-lactate dehydrogenase